MNPVANSDNAPDLPVVPANTPITPAMAAYYLAHKGSRCPYCHSDNLVNAKHPQTDGGIAWQKVRCEDCGGTWTDEYDLAGVRN